MPCFAVRDSMLTKLETKMRELALHDYVLTARNVVQDHTTIDDCELKPDTRHDRVI